MEKINCILLIDDDDVSNRLSYQIIKKLDFANEIKVCNNGHDALEFIDEFSVNNKGKSPELILIDLAMPIMNGFDFIERFNKIQFTNIEDLKTVILTSSSDLKDIRRAKKMGIVDYLIKPLSKGNLIQLLQHHKILI